MKRKDIHYLCSDCAVKMNWRWEADHCATCHNGKCDVCGKEKVLSCENDWIKPNEKTLKQWD